MFERGNRNEYFDCTEMSLFKPCYKVCANMLANRANGTAEAMFIEGQNDFKRGRSCADFAFALTQLSEKLGANTFSYTLTTLPWKRNRLLFGIPL
jgi:hypothetical protein